VNKYLRQSSETFLGLDHECRREVLGPQSRFYMIALADSFSNWIYVRVFRSYDLKRRLNFSATECEQRVIIKFLTNQSVEANKIYMTLSAQFREQTYALGKI
jgi:hypothetical protein